MSKYGIKDWTTDNYQSFVSDLAKVPSLVLKKVAENKSALDVLKPHYSRRALPRPHRLKGMVGATPGLVRKAVQNNRLQSASVNEFLNLVSKWTTDRFDSNKYEELMTRVARVGESDVEQRVNEAMIREDGSMVLSYDEQTKCWSFNLNEQEGRIAQGAFEEGMKMTNMVISALSSGLNKGQKEIYNDYFRSDVSDAETLKEVSKKFGQIHAGMNGAKSTQIILSKGQPSLGRDSMAYVRTDTYPSRLGALIFLGPDFWRQTDSGTGGPSASIKRGATIVHEVSHYFAGTDDVLVSGKENLCYGRTDCLQLDKESAIRNADTFCLFAQEIYCLGLRDDAALAHIFAELDRSLADIDRIMQEFS